jgi:uncharacterized RDD family membrane protein YckC
VTEEPGDGAASEAAPDAAIEPTLDAAPSPSPAPEAGQPEPNVQVLGRRILAIIIDTVLFLLLENLLSRPFIPVHLRVLHPANLRGRLTIGLTHVSPTLLPWLVFGLIVYFTVFEILFAATPGKLLSSLRVVDLNGRRPTWTAILLRNVVRPIDLIGGYIVGGVAVLLSRRRQRLGDLAGKTLVVGAWSVDWIDRSRAATRQRAGIVSVSILLILLIGGIITYLVPPSISPALKETFTANENDVSTIVIPGARRLVSISVGSAHRNGGTATYPMTFVITTNSSSLPRTCRGAIRYHWTGPLDAWAYSGVTTGCVGPRPATS